MRLDGGEVELLADDDRPGGWLLLLDRVRQSYVSLDDPTYLEFPYMQVLADFIDTMPPGPLDVVHLGGGGATLPRWISATRPGSVQVVFESNAELLRVVQTRLPMRQSSGVDFRLGDGRSGMAGLPTDSADVVVVDAFSGGRVPAELSTAEFFAEVSRILRPAGVLLMNTTGAAGSVYLVRLVATIAVGFPELMVHGEQNETVGNLVIMAARQPFAVIIAPDGPLGRPLSLSGPALAALLDAAEPLTDASPMRSPIPPDETWRVGAD